MKSLLPISTLIFTSILLTGCGGVSRNMFTPWLKITTAEVPAGATSVQYNGKNGLTLDATGGTPPYQWSWSPAPNSELPPGLRLNGNSSLGTPQASGEFAVVVTVTDSGHPSAQASTTYTVSVDAPLAIASGYPPNGKVGRGYGPIGTVYLSCRWNPVLGWHLACLQCNPSVAGSCPANTRCVFAGPPCTETVQDHVGFTFKATGGVAPYHWTLTNWPPGLWQVAVGIVNGKPTRAGSYYVTVYVSDSAPTPHQAKRHYTIHIYK
jgi:hypothetical protein